MTVVQLLDRIGEAGRQCHRLSLREVMETVGRRSFGTLLLVVGLVVLAPIIGDIPGVPTLMGLLVVLLAVQMLAGREHFWLPSFLLDRAVDARKLESALAKLRKPVGWLDRLLRERLSIFTCGFAHHVIAGACLCIGLMMPIMEFVPFSANLAGSALVGFGLAIVARDGLLALLALGLTVLTVWVGVAAVF